MKLYISQSNKWHINLEWIRSLIVVCAFIFTMPVSAMEPEDAATPEATAPSGFDLDYHAEGMFAAGSGEFAPYYIMSNNHGVLTQSKDALLRVGLGHKMAETGRWSFGFAADVVAGIASSTPYLKFMQLGEGNPPVPEGSVKVPNGYLVPHDERPASIFLQQLYGEIRYRSVFLMVGLKEYNSALLSPTLSSGDLVESGNARPIPQVRVGFVDFQNIPLTNGWVQIQGEISYGKMPDNKWMRNHYNYYNWHINQGALFTYKRCYFRTKPSQPFSMTVGMQVSGVFGGTTNYYDHGELWQQKSFSSGIRQFFNMFLPRYQGSDYYTGSSMGSWDILGRYRLRNGATIKAYYQHPWEDADGIGFMNGLDGLWGVQFTAAKHGWITSAVVEYLDFTNQGGPFHWEPKDRPGTTITTNAGGGDSYYNNHEYNSNANFGMATGSPFLVSPIYNTDGDMEFTWNRIRGFHIGIEGEITSAISYRVMGGYRRSWGMPSVPTSGHSDTSFMLQASYELPQVKGLKLGASFALDHGTLLGNNTGALVTISYNGKWIFK